MNGVQLLAIVTAAIAVSAVAHRKGFQPGLIIVVLASAASFIPSMPRLELEPEIIFSVVVPPLLYSATRSFSMSSFTEHFRSIVGLGVFLVAITAGVVAVVTPWLVPSLSLGAAFVLAAVISPPDTITTVTHGRQIGLTHRVTSILTGESIVNDAAALTLFSIAVVNVSGSDAFIENGLLLFLYSSVVGFLIGGVLGNVVGQLRSILHDSTLETVLGLTMPFTAYLLAEQVHASGVLAVVMTGFSMTMNLMFERRPAATSFRTRLREDEVWPVIDSLLESFIFAYLGLQLRFVLEDVREADESMKRIVIASAALFLVLVAVRFGWMFLMYSDSRLQRLLVRQERRHAPRATRGARRVGHGVRKAVGESARSTATIGPKGR